jgi:hypothetical protein
MQAIMEEVVVVEAEVEIPASFQVAAKPSSQGVTSVVKLTASASVSLGHHRTIDLLIATISVLIPVLV